MNMIKFLLSALLVLFVSIGFAQTQDLTDRWVFIATTNSGEDAYFDSQTKTNSSAWVKFVTPVEKYKELKRKLTIEKYFYNCKNRTLAIGTGRFVTLSGETKEIASDNTVTYEEVIPDTFGELALNAICSFK